jgi:hypothetical protein
MVGGAEKLWWGTAGPPERAHRAPVRDHQAAKPGGGPGLAPAQLRNVLHARPRGFDAVISGKYPAWMVSHPRHVCYMLHRLRGLYDAYPGAQDLPHEMAEGSASSCLAGLHEPLRGRARRARRFLRRWNELAASAVKPPGCSSFPGRSRASWCIGSTTSRSPPDVDRALRGDLRRRWRSVPAISPRGRCRGRVSAPASPQTPGDRAEHFYT